MEAAAAHPTSDLTQLAGFAGFSASTARKAMPTLETLGIVKRDDTGPYIVTVDGVARGISDEAKADHPTRAARPSGVRAVD
jgi:DNA-binding IclR family transcriptional regulator